ncbi:MAG: hypothetical protein QM765_25010 [Myxococcales bacterium]
MRINVREAQVRRGQVGVAAGALEALRAIDQVLARTCASPDGAPPV